MTMWRFAAPGTRRGVVCALAALALIALLAGAGALRQILGVAVAHKAKTLCSGVFVSHRTAEAVLDDLQADDLALLRHIAVSLDARGQTVRASWFGLLTRQVAYREGLGCSLVHEGFTPPTLPALPQRSAAIDRARFTAAAPSAALDAVIARAFEEPNPRRPRRTRAVVVLHHGRVARERYAAGVGPDTPLAGWSMTKSVMNALTGILVREGRLALDRRVPVPEWQHAGDPRAAITLDHLLRMSSGLRFDEGMSGPRSDVMRMLFEAGDAAAFAVGKDLIAAPGTTWAYSSGTTNIVSRVMRAAFNDDAQYLNFPRHALFDRIGMSSAVLETDASGTFVGSSYMFATARDWARFGMLYLQDGVWNHERVLPEGWVTYTTTPAPADATKRYGAHFWLEIPAEYAGADPGLPVPAFHAAGHEAQLLTIVPSREVVIVRLGRTRYPEAWDHAAFVCDVLVALER